MCSLVVITSSPHLFLWVRVFIKPRGYPPQMFPHQISLTFPSHQNAVSEHYYSSSEGSEAHSLGHPPPRDAFLSDGSPDSRVAPLTDEPYLPPRSQDQTMGHPSPLTYSLPPDNSFPHNLTPVSPQSPPVLSHCSN